MKQDATENLSSRPDREARVETLDELAPLSCAQRRLWFVHQLHPASPIYNIPSAIRIKGRVDLEALKESLREIVRRHEVLRTVYKVVDGERRQLIKEQFTLDIPVISLEATPESRVPSELWTRLEAEASRPCDLAHDLMLRATVFQVAPEECVLSINVHHIACDEGTTQIIFREWAALYQAFARGKPSPLPPLEIQYADYACWQNDQAPEQTFADEKKYWRDRLHGAQPSLELPADRTSKGLTSGRGERIAQTLPADLSHRIRALARSEGVTPFVVLLAACKVLLYRYTCQTDIVAGSPFAGRNRREIEDVIGFFVNMLALRTDLSGDPSFRELLARVRETAVGALAHQEIPFEKVVEDLKPGRVSARNPLFNIVFAVNTARFEAAMDGLEIEVLEVYNHTAKFDLNLTFQDTGDGLTSIIEYRADLFDRSRMVRMLKHCSTLLQSIVDDPNQSISRLNLLDASERRQVLLDWNRTETNFPAQQSIPELFNLAVEKNPEAIALDFGTRRISYRELNGRANQLAHYLRRRRIKPDTAIGICVERSPEMIIGILGILKAGGAYLPLDTTYPRERLAFMARDAAVPIVITHGSAGPNLQFADSEMISLDRHWPQIEREPTSSPPIKIDPENLAYIIYTSGSTGRPKGICIPHRAVNRLVFGTNYVHFSNRERMAQISNASFDAATFEIWGSLLFGGQLVGFSKDVVLSPKKLAGQIRDKGVTSLFLTSALFNQIVADEPDAFAGVTNLLVGGDALDPVSVRKLLNAQRPKRLVNGYGPTETTTFAMWHLIDHVNEDATNIPIGQPLSNTKAYILDAKLQPVPIGIPGELCLGGPGLARGYLNRPELTREKFVPNPFAAAGSTLLYRTGDLARYREDGCVEFLGRMDSQIKLRGYRIELSEIENVLARHPSLREAVVVARPSKAADKKVIAYLVPNQGGAVEIGAVRDYLKSQLPDYMVPSSFMVLDRLPLTPNGKVDRHALPEADSNPTPVDPMVGLPRNNIEKELIAIWEKVLHVRPVSIFDNFFDLGGHSLLAVRLFAEIERVFGVAIPLATLFQAPNIEQLARILLGTAACPVGSCLTDIRPQGSRPPIFWLHTLGGGGGGGLFTYQKLAELLGPDQPSYGLLAPAVPHESIEEMASHYIKEMQSRQPSGPYYLAGYCFGGVVAYEMARQLEKSGEQVALLGLIDSLPPNVRNDFTVTKPAHLIHLVRHLISWLRRSRERSAAQWRFSLRRVVNMLRCRLPWSQAEPP